MSTITLTRGDSLTFQVTINDDATPPVPVPLPDAIIKCAVKAKESQSDSEALIFKRSYYLDEIEISAPDTLGQCLVKILAGDTAGAIPKNYIWDIEVSRREAPSTNVGSYTVAEGSSILTGDSLEMELLKKGDIIAPVSGNAENAVDFTIVSVGGSGDDDDPGVGNLLTDYDGFVDEAGVTFQAYTVNRKTPDGLSGVFALLPDVANS